MNWIAWDALSDALIVIGMISGGVLLMVWLAGAFDHDGMDL